MICLFPCFRFITFASKETTARKSFNGVSTFKAKYIALVYEEEGLWDQEKDDYETILEINKKVIFSHLNWYVVVPTILKMKCQIKVDSIGKKWLGTYL